MYTWRTLSHWSRAMLRAGIGVLVLGLVVTSAPSASAAASYWTHTDGFEGGGGNWESWNRDDASSEVGIDYDPAYPLSGHNYGYFTAAWGWASLGTPWWLGPAQTPDTCTATFMVAPGNMDSVDPVTVNLEIIEPVEWRYVALATHHMNPSGDYQRFPTLTWRGGPYEVYMRISLTGPNGVGSTRDYMMVDRVETTCSFR